MTSYEFERALVYIAEQIIKTFGEDVGVQWPDQDTVNQLRGENAYLEGKVKAYEDFLKRNGIIADVEEEE